MSRTIRDTRAGSDVTELTAEIRRLTDIVAQVSRQIGHDGVATALNIVSIGGAGTDDRIHELARQFLHRAQQMENEVQRFKAVAEGRHA